LKPLAKTSVEKKALRNIDDPFLNLVERLAKNALLQERMTQGTTNLKLEEDPTLYNRQVNFTVPKTVLTENSFSQDLITLHHNMEAIYNEIAGIFVDVATQPDASGMPQLWSFEERQQRLTAFLSQIDAGFSSEADRRYVSRFMHKINQRLKSGEEVAAQPDQVKKNWPVFLRGFAYTLMVVADPGKTDISVNFLPRVISSGSALEGLGFYRTFKEPPSPAWLAEREEAEAAIRAHFRPEDESLS
jgi:hypothetical protein